MVTAPKGKVAMTNSHNLSSTGIGRDHDSDPSPYAPKDTMGNSVVR